LAESGAIGPSLNSLEFVKVFVFRAEFDKQDLRNAPLDDEDGKKD
jgi:hypothetical protein